MKKLTILFALLIFFGCSKDDSNPDENPNNQQDPEVAENVVVILDENSNLTSSETDLNNGVYNIEFIGEIPEINSNDVIVGDEGEGFLRKVISVSSNGNTVSMQTSQATIDDLFNNATIEFTTDISENSRMTSGQNQSLEINYLRNGVTVMENGLDYNFSNTTLYEEAGLNFQITNGTASFDPNFNFKADYSLFGGLDYLSFGTNNATLNIDCDLSLNASGNVNLPAFNETLADFDKKITFLVAGVPVVVMVNTQLVAELSAAIDTNVLVTSGFTNNYTLTSGVKYEDDNWTGNFDLGSTLTPKPIDIGGQINISQNLTITPRVSVKFYSVIGPYCEPQMTEDFSLNVASPSLDWDSDIKVGLNITTGIDITIFGFATDFSRTDSFEETIWNAPYSIEMDETTNNQTANQGEQLAEPIKVRVFDSSGLVYLKDVPVYFNVTSGGGTLDNQSVMTDDNGYAEVNWTLGDNTDPQSVEVTVKNANRENIGSSTTFHAISEGNGIFGTWNISITDTCTYSNGEMNDTATYNGQIILNEDYTVTYVDEDNSNTVSNSFSFSNNTLVISTSYNDYSITPCNGQDSQLVNDTQTMQYDESNDSFSGTTLTSTPEINGVDEEGYPCTILGRTCSGTATLSR